MPFFKAVSADSFLMSNDGTSSNFNLKKIHPGCFTYVMVAVFAVC